MDKNIRLNNPLFVARAHMYTAWLSTWVTSLYQYISQVTRFFIKKILKLKYIRWRNGIPGVNRNVYICAHIHSNTCPLYTHYIKQSYQPKEAFLNLYIFMDY